MFFDVFSALCERKGVSRYKACTDIGLNRAAVAKWKAGATPNGATLAKLAEYFGVTTDFLLGFTSDAKRVATEYKLRNLRAALDFAEGDIRAEIAQAVIALEETYRQLRDTSTPENVAPAPKQGERSVAQNEEEEEILLLARHMEPLSEEDRRTLTDQFRSHIDLYLKARGLSGTEDE